MKEVLEGPLVVKPVSHSFCDVFSGHGWGHYSQFKIIKGTPILVQGEGLSEEDYNLLRKLVQE